MLVVVTLEILRISYGIFNSLDNLSRKSVPYIASWTSSLENEEFTRVQIFSSVLFLIGLDDYLFRHKTNCWNVTKIADILLII
jgi:hypothetical protein